MRKHYLDNIRSFAIAAVLVFHVFYLFNATGDVTNLKPGLGYLPLDVVEYAIYPWIMPLLFLVAGISARYSLSRRTNGQFLKERCVKLLVPFSAGALILGWINGWITDLSMNVFVFVAHIHDPLVRGVVYYLCYIMNVGVLWFLLELFAASLILVLLRVIDRGDRIWAWAGRVVSGRWGLAVLVGLVLPVWGSSMILNTPYVVAFRNGIYWFTFLLGYYFFSHEEALAKLKATSKYTSAAALIFCVATVIVFYGQQYTVPSFLESALVNAYLWAVILCLLGWAQTHMDGTGRAWTWLRNYSFEVYILHYPIMLLTAYPLVTYGPWPMWVNYVALPLIAFPLTALASVLLKKVPVLRFLLFGVRKRPAAA
ncbi:MAG: acyltransferase [Propionibacteriaceae bacterium]|jgi:peptidoglycan/LPS O-acetylase OafA/YrhL|nr:acyltransferase [Propionibacteriaceae bacterium]